MEILAGRSTPGRGNCQSVRGERPTISQHLKVLREANLVRVRRDAQRRIYELNPTGVRELAAWVERLRAFWSQKLDALETAVWFGRGTIEPREGGAVTFMDGHIRGVVTQWKPPRLLAYTWNVFTPGETESSYPESYLTIALERSTTWCDRSANAPKARVE